MAQQFSLDDLIKAHQRQQRVREAKEARRQAELAEARRVFEDLVERDLLPMLEGIQAKLEAGGIRVEIERGERPGEPHPREGEAYIRFTAYLNSLEERYPEVTISLSGDRVAVAQWIVSPNGTGGGPGIRGLNCHARELTKEGVYEIVHDTLQRSIIVRQPAAF